MPVRLDDYLQTDGPALDSSGASATAKPMRLDAYLGASQPQAAPVRLDAYLGQSQTPQPTDVTVRGPTNFDQQMQQQITQANAGRGVIASNVIEALHPGATLMAGLERTLAPAVGLVSPDAARNMTDAAGTLEQTRGNGGLSSLPGQLAGGVVKYANPVVAAGLGMEEAYGEDTAAKDRGEQVGTLDEIAHVAGKGALDAIVGKVFQGNAAGSSIGGGIEKSIQNYVSRYAPQYVAKYGAKAAVGALTNDAAQLAEQELAKHTTQPNTQVGQGLGTNTALGALIPLAHEAVASHLPGAEQGNPGTDQNAGTEGQQVADNGVHPPTDRPQQPAAEEPNLLQKMREQQAAKEQPSAAETTPAPTPATAEKTSEPTPAPEGQKHPPTLDNAAAVGKWYGDTFNDKANASTIEALASMSGDQKYVLADVDPSKVNPSNLMEGDKDQSKVDAIAALTPEQRADLPPTILAGAGNDLLVADGSHRTMGAQQAGDKTMRAYVPESHIGKPGVTAIEQAKAATSRIDQQRALLAAGGRQGAVALPDVDLGPLKKSWDSINRFMGTGANLSEGERDTALNLRTSLGEQDLHRIRTESALKPFRDPMDKWSPDAKAQWVDQVEAGGTSPDPKMQPAADLNKALNDQNIKEGAKYGINTKQWEGDYVGRLAVFPEEAGHNGSRSTIAGPQNFLKGRTFDTFSEFKNYVEGQGGKLMYDNPIDMLLAKQMEIRRSIEARKAMYGEEDSGQLKWAPDDRSGPPLPEDMTAKLDDRLATQERPEIAPKDMVARLAGMQHFDAQNFMDTPEWKSKAQTLRPGDALPSDYTYTGQRKPGQYRATENVAGLFNNMIGGGLTKHVPVLDSIIDLKRKATGLNLGLSAVHGALESVGNAVTSIGRAMDNAVHGEFDLAGKNLMRANPVSAARFGSKVREQAMDPNAHPQLEPLVKASTEGGNRFDVKSVLNKDGYQKASDAWAEGRGAAAATNLIGAVWKSIHAPLFEHLIPNLRASAKAAAAETALNRGLSGPELRRELGLHQDNIDNMMGSVIRSHQFQNKILTDVQDLVFTAPKFMEGTMRFAGATVRDTAAALRDVAQGKAPKITPAMYTAVAGVMTHAIGAALTQMAWTKATTGKAVMPTSLQDYFRPQTGRTNEAGRPERVSMISPFSALFRLAGYGPAGTLAGGVSPLWKSLYNANRNQDEQGVQVRNPNDTGAKQTADTLKYVAKSNAPFAIQSLMQSEKPGQSHTLDAKIGGFLGMKFSHPVTSQAEQAAYDVLNDPAHRGGKVKTQDEADKSYLISKMANEVKARNADVGQTIRQAVRDGKLTRSDVDTIQKRAKEPSALMGLVKDNNIRIDDLMERVWPKATDAEKTQIKFAVMGRIGRSDTLSNDQKKMYINKVKADLRGE